ncbi:MAG: hypothetical protein R6U04_01370 [Bacteroidales bacterium]
MEEVSSLFSQISVKIIELHKCSSKDFLNLKKDFQSYYKITSGDEHEMDVIEDGGEEI